MKWQSLGTSAGLAGLAIGMIVMIFKEVIRKNIFPKLPKEEAFRLLRMIVFFAWTIAIVGIGSWAYLQRTSRISQAPTLPRGGPAVIAGTIVEYDSNVGIGQAQIVVEGRNVVSTSEDSGNFRIELASEATSSRRYRLSVTKSGYKSLDTSVLPPVENLILALQKQ